MYEQTDRPIKLTTPLGANALLLVGLQGREAISELFHFELKTAWNDKTKLLPFDDLLGKKVTVEISPSENKRYFNGIVSRVSQGDRDENFTYYSLEVVPQLWLLDRKLRSRTFQHISDSGHFEGVVHGHRCGRSDPGHFRAARILRAVPRDRFRLCQPPDGRRGHILLLQTHFQRPPDGAGQHAAVPPGGALSHSRRLGKAARTRLPKKTGCSTGRRDRRSAPASSPPGTTSFEMPDKHLEADKPIMDSVSVGTVTHKLKVANNDSLELYDYPGGYASRFDGVNKSGGDQADNLQHIFRRQHARRRRSACRKRLFPAC